MSKPVSPQISPLGPAHWPDVARIQSLAYPPAFWEPLAALQAKQAQSPHGCFVAHIDDVCVAYLISHASHANSAPPLGHTARPATPLDAHHWHVHDMAVQPSARGAGVGKALWHTLCKQLKRQATMHIGLVAVLDAPAMWQRWGFEAVPMQDLPHHKQNALASYGQGACYMQQSLV